nr:hypothetical protein [Tanacetum cinerariifolium]
MQMVGARAEGNAAGQNGNRIRCYNCMGVGHYARNCTVKPKRRDATYLQTQLLITQKEEAGIQLQVEEYDLMAAAADLDEIKEVNANCILMANLLQASTTEEQYTELLEPIPESHQVPQNDNNVISEDTSMEQGLDLPYAMLTILTQKPTEGELDLLFEAMYDDHVGGQPAAAPRTALAAQTPQVLQTPSATTTIADTAPTTTNSSSQATNIPNTSQDVDEIEMQ